MRKNYIGLLSIFTLLFINFSCSLSKPSISELSVKRLKVENDSGFLTERLSVFLLFKDENGREDYNSVIIVHKESGLSWRLNRNNSSFFLSEFYNEEERKNILWLGSNKIAHPLGKIPFGEYIIIVEDLAGNRNTNSIFIKQESEVSKMPFSFSTDSKSWYIKSTAEMENTFNYYSLVLLGADKQPIFVKELGVVNSDKLNGELASLKEEYSDARYIQCLAENQQRSIAYLSKSYKLY